MMPEPEANISPLYQRIYDMVRQIPEGKVATYGQIAEMVQGATARIVGYAMASVPHGSDVPWQRVINSQGKISVRARGEGDQLQRKILEAEGVRFDAQERVDLNRFGWQQEASEFNLSFDDFLEK